MDPQRVQHLKMVLHSTCFSIVTQKRKNTVYLPTSAGTCTFVTFGYQFVVAGHGIFGLHARTLQKFTAFSGMLVFSIRQ